MRHAIRFAILALTASGLAACTALLGVGDLPPATDEAGTPNGGLPPATSVTYVDEDPTPNSSHGFVTIGRATDETDIQTYNVYWGKSTTEKLASNVVAVVSRSSSVLTAELGPAPSDAAYVLVFAANSAAESATAAFAAVTDNHVTFTPIANAVSGQGFYPSAVIDDANERLLVATQLGSAATGLDAGSTGVGLFVAAPDGTDASFHDFSSGFPGSQTPSLALDVADPAAVTVMRVQNRPVLVESKLDGTAPAFVDIGMSHPGQGTAPVTVLDLAGSYLDVVATDLTNDSSLSLYHCDLHGSSCGFQSLSTLAAPVPAMSGQRPSAVLDDLDVGNRRLFVATKTGAPGLGLFECTPDIGVCKFADITSSVHVGSGNATALVLDRANAKLDFVVDDTIPSYQVVRCDVKMSGRPLCIATPMKVVPAPNVTMRHSAVIDADTSKLWVAYASQTDAQPVVARCELDGSGCTTYVLSSGQGNGCGTNPSVVIDEKNRRLVVVTDNAADQNRPAVFTLGLW